MTQQVYFETSVVVLCQQCDFTDELMMQCLTLIGRHLPHLAVHVGRIRHPQQQQARGEKRNKGDKSTQDLFDVPLFIISELRLRSAEADATLSVMREQCDINALLSMSRRKEEGWVDE